MIEAKNATQIAQGPKLHDHYLAVSEHIGMHLSSTGSVNVSISGAEDPQWFLSPSWQAGEIEASEDIAAGRVTHFETAEEFLNAL